MSDRLDTNLHGHDIIVAVTQNNINAHFEYIFGREGGIKPRLEIGSRRLGHLSAVMDPPTVRLNVEREPSKVVFKLALKKGALKYFADDETDDLTEQKIRHWEIGLKVNLDLPEVGSEQMPEKIMDELKKRTGKGEIDPSIFSYRHLLMHFQNVYNLDAWSTSFPDDMSVPGKPSELKNAALSSAFKSLLMHYLDQLREEGHLILGYAISAKNPNVVAPQTPTFPPTDVNYTTNLFLPEGEGAPDVEGREAGLDTLNYLMMSGHRPWPPSGRTGPDWFGNWVSDTKHYGAIAIARRLFVDEFLLPMLAKTTTYASTMTVTHKKAEAFGVISFDLRLTPSVGAGRFQPSKSKPNRYEFEDSYTQTELFDGPGYAQDHKWTVTHKTHVEIEPGSNCIEVVGESIMRCDITHWGGVRNAAIPTLSWRNCRVEWNLPISLENVEDGKLSVKVDWGPNLSIDKSEGGDWLAEAVKAIFSLFGQKLDYLTDVMNSVIVQEIAPEQLGPAIEDQLNRAGMFVFPGGQVFQIHEPVFNNELDLVAYIRYQAY